MRLRENEEKYHDMEVFKMVAKNLKFYRLHHRNKKYFGKNLSQINAAEEMGISRSMLSGIESDNYYVEFSLSIVNRASVVYNIPLHYFFMKESPIFDDRDTKETS